MSAIGRREFLAGAGALAVSGSRAFAGQAAVRPGAVFPATVRDEFPLASVETYMNAAALHPVGRFAARAIEQGLQYRLHGPGPGRADFGNDRQADLKKRFGALINAAPSEIAFTSSTSDGENIVVLGLDLAKKKGNIVIDELHFTTSLYMYKELEKQGVELRIVKHRDWKIDPADMDKAIDRNTRLVSLALVSNVNGFLHDCKAVSAIAHSRGALVFADIIQAVGCVPVDVKALGIDFASTGTYKWIMGERGFGFLYVKEDLQGTVLPTTRYGHRQVSNFNRAQLTWEPMPGAARYETGGIAGTAGRGGLGRHRLRAAPRHRPDSRTCHPADRATAARAAAARLHAADAGRQRHAHRGLRPQGRGGDQQGAAGCQSHGHRGRQRKPPAPVGVGLQHPRRHRQGRRGAGRPRPLERRPRLSDRVGIRPAVPAVASRGRRGRSLFRAMSGC